MRTWLNRTKDRVRGTDRERGETPIAVMLGLATFAVLALAAGPALMSMTAQASANSNDRRADKALAVLTDSARHTPWKSLALGGPYTETITLAGAASPVSTWVQVDPASASRLLITKAVPEHLSSANCATPTPATLPADCIVRTALVAATATDFHPPTSPGITVADPAFTGTTPVSVVAGQDVFTIAVTQPLHVAVIAKASSNLTLQLVSTDIVRAQVDMKSSASGGSWKFGNALVCPSWTGGTTVARLSAPAGVDLSDLLVLTTPAPGACP